MVHYSRDLLLSLRAAAKTYDGGHIQSSLLRGRRRGCRAGRRQHKLCYEYVGDSAIPVVTSARRVECQYKRNGLNRNRNYLVCCRSAHIQPSSASSHLVCASLNAQSINNKFDVLMDYCRENRIDLLSLTETWHEENYIRFRQLISEGHRVLDCPRPVLGCVSTVNFINHGGVAVIGFNGVKLRRFNIDVTISTFEYICVNVSAHKLFFTLLVIYRPGSAAVTSAFFDELSLVLEILSPRAEPLFITGDVNVRLDRVNDIHAQQFNDIISACDLLNLINEPTHDRGGMLDVLIARTDFNQFMRCDVLDIGLSDHRLLRWVINKTRAAPLYEAVYSRSWKELKHEEFRYAVINSPLCDAQYTSRLNVDELSSLYDATITEILDTLIPVTQSTAVKRKSDQWYNDMCRNEKQLCRKFERTYMRTKLASDHENWRMQMKNYQVTLTETKAAFWNSRLQLESSNPRRLWQSLSALQGNQIKSSDASLSSNDFADFFMDKVQSVRDKTAHAAPPSFSISTSVLSQFVCVSDDDILKLLSALPNKQCSLDPIPTWLLKDHAALFSPFIALLVNKSLEGGCVPVTFKSAIVTPILKKSNLDGYDVRNYRPISNLSVISKILERVVSAQLKTYLDTNDLFPRHQSAYRARHSTETALASVLSNIYCEIDSGNLALLSLLDLSAAFDTVDTEILLARLNTSFGLSGTLHEWFRSYLTDRHLQVKFNGVISDSVMLSCGVPQGSVLGPLLFLLYTADVESIVHRHGLYYHGYADDQQTYGSCKPNSDGVRSLRKRATDCIDEVASWMQSNRLLLNSNKTEFMWGASKRRQHQIDAAPFVVQGDAVQVSQSVRNLGVYLNSDLSLTVHVTHVVRTCFGILRQLMTIRHHIPQATFASLVVQLILSRIDYCNIALIGLPKQQLTRLQLVINAAARLVTGTHRHDHITPLLYDLHWLRVPERIEFKICMLVYKCIHGLAPLYLSDRIKLVSSQESRSRLRSSSSLDLCIPATKTQMGDRAFVVAGPVTWNRLPVAVRDSSTLDIFKNRLKTYLFSRSFAAPTI